MKRPEIEILITDGCTREEAIKHLEYGSLVLDSKEILDFISENIIVNPEYAADILNFVKDRNLEAARRMDWSIVEYDGKIYYIMYLL